MRPECEKYAGRLREICEGTADLPLYKINAYRQRWELGPLREDEVVPWTPPQAKMRRTQPWPGVALSDSSVSTPVAGKVRRGCCGGGQTKPRGRPVLAPDGHGPGSQLLKLWTGMPHCDACLALAGQMDAWGPDGCAQRLDQIVADILPRAQVWLTQNHPWVKSLLMGTSTERLVLKLGIARDVKKAIRLAD